MATGLSRPSSRRAAPRRRAAAPRSRAASAPFWAATDLWVRVGGIQAAFGQIGCSRFAAADGFPIDNTRATPRWVPAQAEGATGRFEGLEPVRHAVAIGHDVNGNRRVATNVFGLLTAPWGVSHHPRPALRAPRFSEAAFTVPAAAATLALRIEVAP